MGQKFRRMPLCLVRSCRCRSLPVVVVSGISLVLCLFYILNSRTNRFLEANSFQGESRVRFTDELEQEMPVVGRDSTMFQGGNGGQISMAVDVQDRTRSEGTRDSGNALYISSEYLYLKLSHSCPRYCT